MNCFNDVRLVLDEELRTMNGFLLPPFPALNSIKVMSCLTIFKEQFVVVADDHEVHDSSFATAGLPADFIRGKLAA